MKYITFYYLQRIAYLCASILPQVIPMYQNKTGVTLMADSARGKYLSMLALLHKRFSEGDFRATDSEIMQSIEASRLLADMWAEALGNDEPIQYANFDVNQITQSNPLSPAVRTPETGESLICPYDYYCKKATKQL